MWASCPIAESCARVNIVHTPCWCKTIYLPPPNHLITSPSLAFSRCVRVRGYLFPKISVTQQNTHIVLYTYMHCTYRWLVHGALFVSNLLRLVCFSNLRSCDANVCTFWRVFFPMWVLVLFDLKIWSHIVARFIVEIIMLKILQFQPIFCAFHFFACNTNKTLTHTWALLSWHYATRINKRSRILTRADTNTLSQHDYLCEKKNVRESMCTHHPQKRATQLTRARAQCSQRERTLTRIHTHTFRALHSRTRTHT